MPIRIFNTLTKKKEELIPQEKDLIRMYTCGVTVYDHCHIGHARSLYIFDLIRRYLVFRDFKVHFVRNITDIDDKIIQRAKEQKKTSQEVAEGYIASYYRDLESLKIAKADHEPKATEQENIDEMIKHISGLIEKGSAYEVKGNVYFRVRQFKEYGKLSGQSIEKMREAVRIEKDEKKEDPLDFALWKRSEPDEPSWVSPWGKGRPGWHIECSCMSLKHLKCETLDIHAGGGDLIFPHHENEIAQSEALMGKPFARYWLHHGLLTINGQKMAKSLGNFITIPEALQKYTVDTLKMFFLFSHYASPVDFTEEKMLEAGKALERFDILFWKAYQIMMDRRPAEPCPPLFVEWYMREFVEAMDDDFNTPKALGVLFNFINEINKYIDTVDMSNKDYRGAVIYSVDTLERLARDVFGLFLKEKDNDLTDDQKQLLYDRLEARKKKNFKRSDELREVLRSQGIVVEDTRDGQTWRFA